MQLMEKMDPGFGVTGKSSGWRGNTSTPPRHCQRLSHPVIASGLIL